MTMGLLFLRPAAGRLRLHLRLSPASAAVSTGFHSIASAGMRRRNSVDSPSQRESDGGPLTRPRRFRRRQQVCLSLSECVCKCGCVRFELIDRLHVRVKKAYKMLDGLH
ncbi:hypothetical protein V8C35DRAFT_289908 [Trichoderma chlorosporum]